MPSPATHADPIRRLLLTLLPTLILGLLFIIFGILDILSPATFFPSTPRYQQLPFAILLLLLGISLLVRSFNVFRRRMQARQVDGVYFEPQQSRIVRKGALRYGAFGLWCILGAWSITGFALFPVISALSLLVFIELALTAFHFASTFGGVVTDEAVSQRTADLIAPLAARMGLPPPVIALRDDMFRPAAMVKNGKITTLVLSISLIDELDDEELTALLAHELAHLHYNDLRSAVLRGRIASVMGILGEFAILVAMHGVFFFPALVAAFYIVTLAANAAMSSRNRWRELRADAYATSLLGSSSALEHCLTKIDHAVAVLKSRLYHAPWKVLLLLTSWSMPTHPPISLRIERMQASTKTHIHQEA